VDKALALELLIFARGKTLKDNEGVPDKTHLQKEMFLLQKETSFSETALFEFVPHYYGPYSRELEDAMVGLTRSGGINDSDGYYLTPSGFKEAHKTWINLTDAQRSALVRIKENYNRISSDVLLKYVYDKYKKYTTKSALYLGNILDSFHSFAIENDITEEYIQQAVSRVRHPGNENSH
jgi:uncharacterized protein YwgA